jgi:hypothetical protein
MAVAELKDTTGTLNRPALGINAVKSPRHREMLTVTDFYGKPQITHPEIEPKEPPIQMARNPLTAYPAT